jgi:hypothetical protein
MGNKTQQIHPLYALAAIGVVIVCAIIGFNYVQHGSATTSSITGGTVVVQPTTPTGVNCAYDYAGLEVKYTMTANNVAGTNLTGTAYVYDTKPTFWADERGADDKSSLLGPKGASGSLATGNYAFSGVTGTYYTHIDLAGYEDVWYEGPVIPACGTEAAADGYAVTFKQLAFDTTALLGAAMDSGYTHTNSTTPSYPKWTKTVTVDADHVVIIDQLYATGIQIDESLTSIKFYLQGTEYVVYDADKAITPDYGASGYEFKADNLGIRIAEDDDVSFGVKITATETCDGAAVDGDSKLENGEKISDALHIYDVEGNDLAAGNDITV